MKNKNSKSTLDIGEVAALTGLRPSTLRFYEEKGLIKSTGRNGLRRLFSSAVLENLELIALAQLAGFTLDEIIKMLAPHGRFQIDRKQLLAKANELEKKIKQLIAIKDSLRHVAKCSVPNQLDCPKFQKLLHLAGRKRKVSNSPLKH